MMLIGEDIVRNWNTESMVPERVRHSFVEESAFTVRRILFDFLYSN